MKELDERTYVDLKHLRLKNLTSLNGGDGVFVCVSSSEVYVIHSVLSEYDPLILIFSCDEPLNLDAIKIM